MFHKLRNKIILITMVATTAVLVLAGFIIMFSASITRPEPDFHSEPLPPSSQSDFNNEELESRIKKDREEGNLRLLTTLINVGIGVEIIVFLITYYFSEKIIAPVKDSYDKQKLFIANASHELKTPLAVIQANMEALDVSKDNQKWKNNIETEITHANKLVQNLLQLARMDASTSQSKAEKFDLNREIKTHLELFRPKFSGQIIYHDNSKANYTLPKQDILQIIDILLDNATKYGNQKIAVSLSKNQITVTNDGTTIAKKDLNKIFDRFYQTDKTREGSGLGLAIAQALCKQNNWRIFVESANCHTEFTVQLSN